MLTIKIMSKHIFKDYAFRYKNKGYAVIPDRYMGKTPLIKGWSDYCYKMPSTDELTSWVDNFNQSNIAVCCGEASGIIAIDVDTDDAALTELILEVLPESPVEKKGERGFTRFFRYMGETNIDIKFNGKPILELLSSGKKSTIPPSIHPNGKAYQWRDRSLLDIRKDELPIFPPMLFANLQNILKINYPTMDATKGNTRLQTGRTLSLSTYCGKLMRDKIDVDTIVQKLIKEDVDKHDEPLFTDPSENKHTEQYTNALAFYVSHLETANNKHFRSNEEYEIPFLASCIDEEAAKIVQEKKSQRVELEEKSRPELPIASHVLKNIYQNIMDNSFIKQDEFAFSAALVMLSTVISRKLVFQGMAPNLYVLNIAPSGSGKDMCQQKLKEYLVQIKASNLLGAGDYVSDASLVDSLDVNPVRLDIMDEMGGILKTVTTGKSEYNGKMADVLAELYTCSNNLYLGRATAERVKGMCYRPNINILGSTTPAGFSEGVSLKAIEKGLLGRFLVFQGDAAKKAERVKNFTSLDLDSKNMLSYWAHYKPDVEDGNTINGIEQEVLQVQADTEANARLDELFNEFDELRRSTKGTDPKLPIICRLYQQMVKLVLIHSVSRCGVNIPVVNKVDVEFGYKTILYYYHNFSNIIDKYIHEGSHDKKVSRVFNIIEEGMISKASLVRKTKWLNKRERNGILEDLVEAERVYIDRKEFEGRNQIVIRSI